VFQAQQASRGLSLLGHTPLSFLSSELSLTHSQERKTTPEIFMQLQYTELGKAKTAQTETVNLAFSDTL
jgi:hypothetical protein